MEEKTKYPIKFEACPSCGSTDRVAQGEADKETSKGNLGVGTKIAVLISKTIVFNPADTTIIANREVPMLMGFYDVCAKCGTVYCIEMQKETAMVGPQPPTKRPGGDGGGFGQILGRG